jgi:hypothetical protein
MRHRSEAHKARVAGIGWFPQRPLRVSQAQYTQPKSMRSLQWNATRHKVGGRDSVRLHP